MESNDNYAIKTRAASASAADEIAEKRLLTCGSKPKIQLLELNENIRVAESSFDSIKEQWDKMKFRGGYCTQNESKLLQSQNSTSSYGSLRNMPSEHSILRHEEEEETEEADNDRFADNITKSNLLDRDDSKDDVIGGDNKQLEIVLTPRTPNNDGHAQNYVDIRHDDSLESVKTTNRRGKRAHPKLKKNNSVCSKMNDDPYRTSLIYAAAKGKNKRKQVNLRLRSTNSKSTIATRDTVFSDKKQEKKKFRRQKSVDAISLFQAPKKRVNLSKSKQANAKQRAESNNCPSNKPLKKGSLAKFEAPPILRLDDDTAHMLGDDKGKRDFSVDGIEKVLRVDDNQYSYYEAKGVGSEEAPKAEEQKEQAQQASYYDPLQQRNYELPTESSKLKRVERPFYHRFAIRSIPFVVGTSLSPSHNLGLNIQQVLSTIKIKQPTVPGISPLLIQSISKGVRPVSILFQHMNDARSCRSYSGHEAFQRANSELHHPRVNSFSCEHFRSNNNINGSAGVLSAAPMTQQTPFAKQSFACEPLYEEDEDAQSQCSESRAKNHQISQERSGEASKPAPARNVQPKQARKQQSIGEIGYQMTGSNADYASSNSGKEMTQVFTRLYEQFDKMITQHEKLKEQMDKTKDKLIAKEVTELEEAITAKEQEITAVVNLYKEVKALKKQMKRMYERNSFVCIATEDPAFHHTAKIRASTADPWSQKYHCDGRVNSVMHEAPNALRLTGLLRQIQAFQRQLALA